MENLVAPWRRLKKPTVLVPIKTVNVDELVDALSRGHPVDAKHFLSELADETKTRLVELTSEITTSPFTGAFLLDLSERAFRQWLRVCKRRRT